MRKIGLKESKLLLSGRKLSIRLLRKLAMTTIAVFTIGLLANFLLETKDTNAGRQPGNFLNQDFWNNYSNTGNIIAALYGDGTPNTSAYNRFWTGGCNISNVVYVNPGIIPPINANTIYVLNSGNYTISAPVVMNNCSALIGKGKSKITALSTSGIYTEMKKNIIIDNLRIQGNTTSNGINMNNASQNTINNVEVWGSKIGIYSENSRENTINNSNIHNNTLYGIQLNSGSNGNYISNSQIYNHTGNSSVGILIMGSSFNNLNNNQVYNNKEGIRLGGNEIKWVDINSINNSQIYNNYNGIVMYGHRAVENIINNCDIYNNKYGYSSFLFPSVLMPLDSDMESIDHGGMAIGIGGTPGGGGGTPGSPIIISGTIIANPTLGFNLNNIEQAYERYANNIYKDKAGKVLASFDSETTGIIIDKANPNNYINNSNFYNNDMGIYLMHYTGGNAVLGIEAWTNLTYYGENKIFNNSVSIQNNAGTGKLITGTNSNLLGWDAGTFVANTENMSNYWITNPVNAIGNKLINDFTDRSSNRGTGTFLATTVQPIKYIIGKNIAKQKQPVRWVSDGINTYPTLFGSPLYDWDTNDYIASVSNEVNLVDENIINYYYGPDSEFITNRSGNNCSLGAFTVEYVNNNNITSKLLDSGVPLGHTIYVIEDGEYNIGTATIAVSDNCVAIVNQGSGVTINRSSTNQDPLIKLNGQENIILNNLNLNGNNASNYGILMEKVGNQASNNNTINNVKSYNHRINGIMLGASASYNTIMNTQTWNNQQNGIEIYLGGQYNVINNSLSYNNNGYGIRFGNISKYNTINNGQFFNNGIGGIFADFTTEQNIINNVHTYNNAGYGINFKRSSGNNLNNIYAYNNKTGINISDISCVNNKFNGDLMLFANGSGDMVGTNGNDNFLSSENGNGTLAWLPGTLQTGNDNMNCSWSTNPRHISTNTDWFLNIGSGCNATGKQSSWNPATPNSIEYMFGLGISKQIEPVGYIANIIGNLNNQHNTDAYIGEINPIIWTKPTNIILISGNMTNLELNTNHEIDVIYDTGMINHNFDARLTINTVGATGYIAIKNGASRINMGTGVSDLPFADTQIMLVITTADEYNSIVSGSIFIGTDTYGSNIKNFSLTTKPDPTPPTITWIDNIAEGGIWEGQSNNWKATVTGIYTTSLWAKYVTGASDCVYTTTGGFSPYLGTLEEIPYTISGINNKYVCIYAQDTVNGQIATGLSNQIKISKLEFVDNVAAGPVYYDIININFQNLINYGYRRVNTASQCGIGLSGLMFNTYTDPIILNSNTSYNGKYLCAYGQDSLGSGRYLASSNDINISDYSNTVRFNDDVENHRVSTDTINVYFSGSVAFSHKKYKWVYDFSECNNTNSMVDYTGHIVLTDDSLNGQYFCLYSRQQGGTENYLISSSPVTIDSTNPTTPSIESPINEEDVTFFEIETYGAIDNESGLTGFEYQIAENLTFLDIVTSEIYYTTGTSILPNFDGAAANYAIRVRAVDGVGNKSNRSTAIKFNYKALNNFRFENVQNARTGETYTSNTITMNGLDTNQTIWAAVTNGVLYRNGTAKGMGTLVQNNDSLSIKMLSSNIYSGITETKLVISNRKIPWQITTMSGSIIGSGSGSGSNTGNCNLSNSQRLAVAAIFNGILATYTNETELGMFLITMKSMLEDNIDLEGSDEEACNMIYLLNLISNYLENELDGFDERIHIAPNCKEYNIEYSDIKGGYYGSNMIYRMYFGSRDDLGKYIDSKNPGDCHVNTYGNIITYDNSNPNKHVAPNGKVYTIQSSDIGYTSTEFSSVKYFASISELRSYIDKNNPTIIIRNHQVDATFEPVTHIAPNGKDYKIYKTNRGHMSYKLLKVQYFGSLEELKNYIDKNNKSK